MTRNVLNMICVIASLPSEEYIDREMVDELTLYVMVEDEATDPNHLDSATRDCKDMLVLSWLPNHPTSRV